MAFCRQCGQEIPDDYRFCAACGSPQEAAASTAASSASFDMNAFGALLKGTVTGMIIAPVTTIRNLGRMELQNTLIIGGVMALIYGLVGIMLFNTVLSGIAGSGLGFFMPDFGEYGGQVFLYMALLGLVCMGGLSLGLWLTGKYLFKGRGEYVDFLTIAIVGQIPMMGALLAGSILSYITAYLGMLMIVIGSIITPITNYAGLHQISGLDENRSAFAVALAYVVMYIVLAIVLKIVISNL